jgi:hypothetical protein
MEATSSIGTFPTGLGLISAPKIEAKMPKTVLGLLLSARTPLPVDITLSQEPEYSDEQFHADLRKASKKLDLMESKALEEHAQGKTRKFPA